MELELYHTLYSTCSQKVRLCLAEKRLPWRDHHMDLFDKAHMTAEYRAINQNGVVPTLVHGGRSVIESSVIIEYIDDVFPEPALAPRNSYEKAQLRAWLYYINEVPTEFIRYPTFNVLVDVMLKNTTREERARDAEQRGARKFLYRQSVKGVLDDAQMTDGIDGLRDTVLRVDSALAKGDWIMGSMFSLAEIALTPTFDRMDDLGLHILWADKPRVIDWWQRVRGRPSFAEAFPAGARVSDAVPSVRDKTRTMWTEFWARTAREPIAAAPPNSMQTVPAGW